MKRMKNTWKLALLSLALGGCCIGATALYNGAPVADADGALPDFAIAESAAIRMEGTGLRFSLSVDKEYYQSLTTGTYVGYEASVGALVLPTDILNTAELTAEGDYGDYAPVVADLTNVDVAESTADRTKYNVVVTDIPFEAYEQALSVRGFIKLTKEGENDRYIYTSSTSSAAIAEVATDAYANAEGAEKEALKTFLENAVVGTTAAFDEASYLIDPPEMQTQFTLLGNKYGFEPSAEWIAHNVVFATADEGIAKVDGTTLVAQAEGTTTLTASIGDNVIASSTVTVGDFTITDANGAFTYEHSATTSVTPTTQGGLEGYELASLGQTSFAFNQTIKLNQPNANIFQLNTSTSSSLTKVVIRFTDATDPTKGVAFGMVNAASDGIGWGATAATYVRSGDLNDTFEDDFGKWTAIANPKTYLAANSEGQFGISYSADEGKFFAKLLDTPAWYYGLKHQGEPIAFSEGNDDCNVNVTVEITTARDQAKIFVSNVGGGFGGQPVDPKPPVVDPDPEPTGEFTCTTGATATKVATGYEITAVSGSKVTYNAEIDLNDPNADIFKFTTSTPDVLADMIIRFTDVNDPTKGVAIRMVNAAATNAYGWGATAATYIRSGNVSDTFSDDFGGYTAVANDGARLGSATASVALRFDESAEKKFSIYLPDPQYYGLLHLSEGELFSEDNTTNRVKVSIEFLNNNPAATILVTNIGGELVQTAPPVDPTPDPEPAELFTCGDGASAVKTAGGYELTVASNSTVQYNKSIALNTADGVFKFHTTTPATLTQITIRFTDYYDESKGIAISMVNAASNGIGWGATAATYIRSGNVSDTFKDDFGYWTAISNPKTALMAGDQGTVELTYSATDGNFCILIQDEPAWPYGMKHTGDKNPFSEGNTTYRVKVSIEILTSGQPATVLVGNIGGALAE